MNSLKLPTRTFNLTDYPNMDEDDSQIGQPIPIGWGTLKGLAPTCIDTEENRWKILDQAIQEISLISADEKDELEADVDYTEDLDNGEFVLLSPKKLSLTTEYYIALEVDYPISSTNYLSIQRNTDQYANGTCYSINSADGWTAGSGDFLFDVYGKVDPSDDDEDETLIVSNVASDETADLALHDATARTRLGQSFKTGTTAYCITKIIVYTTEHGSVSGYNIRAVLYSDRTGTQVDIATSWVACAGGAITLTIPTRYDYSNMSCNVKAPATELTNVADILEDIVVNILGKSSSLLDATGLATLKAAKTEVLAVYIDQEMTFGDLKAKLEVGQLFKLLPLEDGTYLPIIFSSAEPSDTLHFLDIDLMEDLKVTLDADSLIRSAVVKYGETWDDQSFQSVEATSALARFFYRCEESLEIETYLTTSADAAALAADLIALYETVRLWAYPSVHGQGLDRLPGRDKIKLTRARAPYTGGKFAGVLFRPFKTTKKLQNATVEYDALLDTQSYAE